MIKLKIDRSKWARGGIKGDAKLLNSQGNMCCLGFACLAAGVPEDDIKWQDVPGDLASEYKSDDDIPDGLHSFLFQDDETGSWKNNCLVDDAVGVNDDTKINDEEREEKLKPILAKLGFDVEFV